MNHNTLPDFDSRWDFNQPSETEASFRKIFDEVEEIANEAYLVELQTQIARTLGLQRKFGEAHTTLDSIQSLPSVASGRARVRYLLERGRVFNSSGNKSAALPLFTEAWNLGKQLGEDGLAVDAAHMVAIVESPDEALNWNLKALDLATSSTRPAARKWRKSLHNNLGWTFFAKGEFDKALAHFEKCRDLAAENGDAEAERIANWCIAKTLRFQGNLDIALEMQQRQLDILEAEGKKGPFVYEELGECLFALGRTEEALPFFGLAYDGLSEDAWIVADEPDRIARLGKLSGRLH